MKSPRHLVVLGVLSAAVILAGCASPPSVARSPGGHDRDATEASGRASAPAEPTAAEANPAVTQKPGALTSPVWERIGMSGQGRVIEATSLGSGGGPRVLLVGGIHGDEPEGGRTINAIEAYLRVLRPRATVRIVRDINPDGTTARSRHNAAGVDLNRNWPARNYRPGGTRGSAPLSEPESRALYDEIERFDPDLVLVAHSSSRGPFVNFDGPAVDFATVFATAAAATDPRWRVVADMGYATPGSLGSFIGVDRGTPILTLEFDRGHEPDAAWQAMREGVRAVIEHAGLAQ